MKMRKLGAILLLAGCATLDPVAQDVALSDSTLTVVMSNGTRCKADWRAGPGEICGYRYQVVVDAHPNPLRQISQQLVQALGGNFQPPLAEVLLTDARGHVLHFISPKPVDLHD